MTEASRDAALPRRVPKPWGYELWYALTDQYAGKILHVNKGHRLSLQLHSRKDESCYLLSGQLRLAKRPPADELQDTVLNEGDVWRNRPGELHTIEALADSDVLEVASPRTNRTNRTPPGTTDNDSEKQKQHDAAFVSRDDLIAESRGLCVPCAVDSTCARFNRRRAARSWLSLWCGRRRRAL